MTADVLAASAVTVVVMMLATWLLSVFKSDASLVDLVWGLGFVLVGWTGFGIIADPGPRRWLLVGLVTIWGLRLSLYLTWRNLGKEEDYRYQAMRRKRPETFWWQSLFRVFGFQGVIMWVVSLPVQMGQVPDPSPLGWLDWVGASIWLVGIGFESVGDFQLARFKADPANEGQVLDRGLWRYTRHPNYFGDFLVWWGLYAIALSAGQWWTVVGPLLMSLFLMKVSGVGPLEKDITDRRPAYADYIERTNGFFPGPPSD